MKSLCNYNIKIKRKQKFVDYIQEITYIHRMFLCDFF